MKNFPKVKIVFFLLFFQSSLVSAQILRVGPKVGVQASRAIFDDKEYYEMMKSNFGLGFHAGLVTNVRVSDMLSLQSELLYNQISKRLKAVEIDDYNYEKYNFITLPVLLRLSHRIGYHQIYVNAGPNISYWLGGKGVLKTGEVSEYNLDELSYTISFDESERDTHVMVVSDPNRFQLGIDLGVGGMLPISKSQHLMIDFRYTFGHTNMAKPETQYIGMIGFNDDLNYSNHVFSFSCAYLIDFDLFTMSTKGKTISTKKK